MKYKVLIFIFGVFLRGNLAFELGNCKVDDKDLWNFDTTKIYEVTINDVDALNEQFSFEGELNVNALDTAEDTAAKYTEIVVENNNIILRTNKNFDDFEKDQIGKDPGVSLQIKRGFTLQCLEGNEKEVGFTLILTVTDTNNHKPSFTTPSYSYTLPSPLTPRLDLTSVGDSIVVEDLDFSNTDVKFEISGSGSEAFTIETDSSSNSQRIYKAILKVTKYTELSDTTTLTITATDNGDPQQTSDQATITIEVDKANSLPVTPTFSVSMYSFKYSTENGLTSTDGQEIVITTSDPSAVAVTLTDQAGDESAYFKANYDESTGKVTIEPTGTQPEVSSSPALILTLKVQLKDNENYNSKSILLIQLPSELVFTAPKFSQPYYKAQYMTDKDPHYLVLDEDITLNEEATVTLEDDDSHFGINNTDDKWVPTVTDNLNDTTLKSGEEIILTLHAIVTSDDRETMEDFATLIVALPPVETIQTPKFSSNLYSATYTNGQVTFDEGTSINADSEGQTVDIKIISAEPDDGTNYFSLNKKGDVWEVTGQNLPETVLNSGGEYVFALEATISKNTEVVPGYSTLVITVPAPPMPTFDKILYTATYILGDVNDTVDITNGPITVKAEGKVSVIIEPSEYSDYFDISDDSENDNYQVTVKDNLSQDIFDKQSEIILTLSATVDGFNNKEESILVITLPKSTQDDTPKFTEPFYEGIYSVDENQLPSVALDTSIKVSFSGDVQVNLKEAPEEFDVIPGEDSNTWTINVTKPLEENTYSQKVEIFTLQAFVEGKEENVGTGTLIILLPDSPTAPKFSHALYHASYDNSGESPSVQLTDGPIELSSTDSVSVKMTGTYADKFDFDIGKDPQLSVKAPLNSSVISANQEILLTLEASFDGSTEAETAIVAVTLPHVDALQTLKFNNPSYEMYYKIEKETPTIDYNGQTIKIENTDASVDVTVEGSYGSNFKLERNTDDGTYTITVSNPLDPNDILTKSDILLTLKATLENFENGFATILLNLPAKEASAIRKFTETTYTGQYKLGENDQKDSVDVDLINIEGATADQVNITFAESNDNFELTPNEDNSGYIVNVKEELDPKTLLSEVNIVLKLQATIEDGDEVGEATLVIELPKEITPFVFSKPVYNAKYNNEDEEHPTVEFDVDEEIEIVNLYSLPVTVALSSDYTNNFKISESSPYEITISEPLDPNILKAGNDLVVSLIASWESTEVATATVIIALPEIEKSPKFTKPTYTATYTQNTDSKYEVILIDHIETDAEDPAQVSIKVEDNYLKNFEIKYDTTASEYQVSILGDGLDLDTIDEPVIYVLITVDATNDPDFATLAIRLPEKNENIVPTFSDVIYYATYTKDDISDISPSITLTSDKAGDTTVTVTGKYSGNFEATSDDNVWKIKVTNPLTDVTDNEIYVTIEAHLTGSLAKGTATIVVRLLDKGDFPAPRFTKPVFSATYTSDNKLENSESITIDSSYEPQVVVTLEEEYKKYFSLNHINGEWKLELEDNLPDDILKDNTNLIIQLTAHLDGSEGDGAAALIVNLPNQQESIAFENAYYEATYQQNEGDTNDEVKLKDDTKIIVPEGATVTKPDSENFEVKCDSTECTLSVLTDLTDEILKSQTEILLVLKATKNDVSAYATIIIALPLQEKVKAPEFSQPVYTATYDDGKIKLDDEEIIGIIGDATGVEVTIDENSKIEDQPAGDYINIEKDTDQWVISARKDLPSSVITKESAVLVELKATNTDVTDAYAKAGLVIKLPKSEVSSSFNFKENAYIADYETDGTTGKVTLLAEIELEGEWDGVEVAVSGDYAKSFTAKIDTTTGKVTFSAEGVLESSVLDSEAAIAVNLAATKDSETAETTVVVRLPKKISPTSIYFKESSYMAEYSVEDDKPSLSLASTIELANDDNKATVTLEGDYTDYFVVTYDETITFTLKDDAALPDDVLTKTLIYVDIVATKDDETTKTKVIITLPTSPSTGTFDFDDSVYLATYDSTEADKAKLTLDKDIKITGTFENVNVAVSDEDYKTYFEATFDSKNGQVEIEIIKELEDSILEHEVAITINIEASTDSESHTAVVVIKLPKGNSAATLHFGNVVYVAEYTLQDDSATVITEGDIIIHGVDDSTTLKLADYADYFDVTLDETNHDKIILSLTESLKSDLLDSEGVLSTDIVATSANEEAKTKLIIKLPIRIVPTTFYFSQTTYIADFEQSDDGSVNFTLSEPIAILGEPEDVETVKLEGDKAGYFSVARNDDNTVTITSTKPFEDSYLKEEAVLSLNILATKGNETSKAALVIKLPKSRAEGDNKDSYDETGLIAAVAVLAVLLVASLVGSAVFYYLKFKRSGNFSNESPRQTFRQNPHATESHYKIEHPTRRPTGVIKYTLEDVDDGFTVTDDEKSIIERSPNKDTIMEKRKSVQFDTVNIDEMEVEKPQDDTDDNDGDEDYGNVDDNDERRSSRV